MKVKDVMVGTVVTCSTNDDVNRAAQLMWENDCGAVPVVEADDYLVGMITDRDACMAAYTKGLPLNAIRVGDVMTRELKTCRPDEDAGALNVSMRAHRVRRLPVINALGRLVGLVSLSDMARRAAQDRGSASKGVSLEAVAETLAAVSQPWNAPLEQVAPPAIAAAAARDPLLLRPQRAR